MYYSDYLQLDKILNAQDPESKKAGVRADDEMLFIIIHQNYELWFKQILHEVNLVREIFSKSSVNDNSSDLQIAVHRMKRVTEILHILVNQIDILETMTPLDFLDFRDLLRPASGFQSIQFKILEASLGLKFGQRFGGQYYLTQLRPEDVERVKNAEHQISLTVMLNQWLERMPYFDSAEYWPGNTASGGHHPFWQNYRDTYANSLQEGEKKNLEAFDRVMIDEKNYPEGRNFSPKANRAALFIMLYRDYPLLHPPFQLLNSLLDIDDLMAQWRYRHMNMVLRMIGKRVGTGGSSGAEYLRSAAESHYIFRELAELTSFLIQRNKLPALSPGLEKALRFG